MATLKNTTISGTEFLKLPTGTLAQRPGSPSAGQIRYNSDRTVPEVYTSQWGRVAKKELDNAVILELDPLNFPASNRTALWNSNGPGGNNTSYGWNYGSGGATGFSQNGGTNENERVLGTDPWGNQNLVWETRASGNGNDDGGWNGDGFACDVNRLYRFSIWVKRTSSTSGGTFYHGTSGGSQCVRRLSDGGQECNPYWECSGTGVLTQDVWYLYVSHMFPWWYSLTAGHPESGRYRVDTGKEGYSNGCNVGNDTKMDVGTTSISQRVYHYYCGDSTTRLQLFDPRVEICDGTQPSVSDLLFGRTNRLNDSSGHAYGAYLQGNPIYNTEGSIVLDGNNDGLVVPNIDLRKSWTMEIWMQTTNAASFSFFGHGITSVNQGLHIVLYNSSTIRFGMYGNDNDATGLAAIPTNTWIHWMFSYDHSNPTSATAKRVYRNGVEQSTSVVSGPSSYTYPPSNLRIGNTYGSGVYGQAAGKVGISRMYNRVLTAAEVLDRFDQTRGRYGI